VQKRSQNITVQNAQHSSRYTVQYTPQGGPRKQATTESLIIVLKFADEIRLSRQIKVSIKNDNAIIWYTIFYA